MAVLDLYGYPFLSQDFDHLPIQRLVFIGFVHNLDDKKQDASVSISCFSLNGGRRRIPW
jgi:hypothetical protein